MVMWAMFAAPLEMGADIRNISPASAAILKNPVRYRRMRASVRAYRSVDFGLLLYLYVRVAVWLSAYNNMRRRSSQWTKTRWSAKDGAYPSATAVAAVGRRYRSGK